MISDDLSTLFPYSSAALSFRQGLIKAWDAATGANTIQVGGADIVNVPSLTSESASIKPNDVVMLLASGNSWLVLGKVTTPGDPGTVPSWDTDLAALAPLTDLAAVTTGTTINGATVDTSVSSSGRRVVIVSDPDNRIDFYSGESTEVTPGGLNTDGSDLVLTGPIYDVLTNPTGQVFLRGQSDVSAYADANVRASNGLARLEAGHVFGDSTVLVIGSDAASDFGLEGVIVRGQAVRIGDATNYVTVAGKVVTNADLSSGTNTFPASMLTATGAQAVTNKDLTDATNAFPFKMATGTVLVTGVAANTRKQQAVSFPAGRFTSPPTVVVSPASSADEIMTAAATDVTTSGFTINFRRSSATSTNVSWIAIQSS